jgi:DNA-binding NarL/FixJ family response regulator
MVGISHSQFRGGLRKLFPNGHGERKALPRMRILLADDNPAILKTVRRILRQEFTVAAVLPDGESVLREVPNLNPDLIVIDISMGELGGIEVAQRLSERGCPAKIVFLTVHEAPELVKAAFEAGAAAYVFKILLATDLIPAIHAACEGRSFVSSRTV